MDENIELLQDIYQKVELSLYALEKLAKSLKNSNLKIKDIIKEERKMYKNYLYEVKELLLVEDIDPISNHFLTKLGSGLEITMKVCVDDPLSILEIIKNNTNDNLKVLENKFKAYQEKLNEKVLLLVNNFINYQKKELEKIEKCY